MYDLIRRFWERSWSTVEISLFFFLLCHDGEHTDRELLELLDTSEKTLRRARVKLRDAGFITYTSGQGRHSKTIYSISGHLSGQKTGQMFCGDHFLPAMEQAVISGQKTGHESGHKEKEKEQERERVSNDISNLPKEKEIDKEREAPLTESPREKVLDLSFCEPEYSEIFLEWLTYKKQRRETYKTQQSMKICYNKLVRMAHNNPDTARLIVEQSMANNWAGLFELKPNSYEQRIDEKQQRDGNFRQHILDKLSGAKPASGSVTELPF